MARWIRPDRLQPGTDEMEIGKGGSVTDRSEHTETGVGNDREAPRKPYQRPSFRHERVFETMALACGKMSTTENQCKFIVKNS